MPLRFLLNDIEAYTKRVHLGTPKRGTPGKRVDLGTIHTHKLLWPLYPGNSPKSGVEGPDKNKCVPGDVYL